MFPVTMLRNVQPAVIRRPRMTSACMRALKLNEHLRRHSTEKVVPQEKPCLDVRSFRAEQNGCRRGDHLLVIQNLRPHPSTIRESRTEQDHKQKVESQNTVGARPLESQEMLQETDCGQHSFFKSGSDHQPSVAVAERCLRTAHLLQ